MSFFNDFKARHEALKKRIHSYRMPLSPGGRFLMGVVYFFTPVIGGYYLMQQVNAMAERNLADLRSRQAVDSTTQAQNRSLRGMLEKHKEATAAATGTSSSATGTSSSATETTTSAREG